MLNLENKVVLVTGAAGGIGRESVLAFVQAGARVVATDIHEAGLADLAKETRTQVRTMAHDVTEAGDWQRIIASIESQEGRLDVLFNNAGAIMSKHFVETSFDEFRRIQRINVDGVWLGMQSAQPLMTTTAAGAEVGGSIINMSSIYGQVAGPNHAAYCASKGAVRMLTKAVAVEFANPLVGIRVNSIHPGPIDTEFGFSSLAEAVAQGRMKDLDSGKELVAARFPAKRWGTPVDIAGAVLFLASDLSRFMVGAELTVDGGYTVL